ncbi:META domain-containing protein [Marinobacter pelagius]|uniref:META domain-containing protein n=1 Tax=Marinobacter sp. C7 TaxID=2951363 RepID=UPI001EF1538E|nr:META domain-containing protein [Marinobacter sp. C7]MCG7198245.1 META domain-containing protein [Marinobacter sp. C7]
MFVRRCMKQSVLVVAGLLAGCATSGGALTTQEPGSVYHCGQLEISVTPGDGGDLLGIDYLDRRLLLKPAESASGALYVAPGDEQTRFWSKGERAALTIRGEAYPECLAPGAVEVPFEARGNEPFWRAVVEGDELLLERPFESDGAQRLLVEAVDGDRHGRTVVARAGGLNVSLTVARQLCQDTMSGAQYPAQVRLQVNGEPALKGCGGDRQRLLRGAEWVVEDIAGAGIIDGSRVTLRFLSDNRVAGRASCNRYTGSYQLSGEGISFGAIASTRRACVPALMNQEDRFLEVLGEVSRFEIGRHGQLELTTASGDTLTAFQSTAETP